jgi:hypothetical protein
VGNIVRDAAVGHILVQNAIGTTVAGNTLVAADVTPSAPYGVIVNSTGSPGTYPHSNLVGVNNYVGLAGPCPAIENSGSSWAAVGVHQFQRGTVALPSADATPSVKGGALFTLANSSPQSVTNFDDGVEGQEITIRFSDANTTLTTTNFLLNGNAAFVSSYYSTITLVKMGTYWVEKGRMKM